MKITKVLSEHKIILLWLAVIWTAIVAFFCLISFNDIPTLGIKSFDKVGHFVFHFGITSVWFLNYRFRKADGLSRATFKAFLFSLVYGITIEFIQAFFTTTRQGDINDVFANTTGSVTAVVLIYTVGLFYQKRSSV